MFEGKTVLVTGGSQGIGRSICETFAAQGASVAFLYVGEPERAKETLEALGTNAKAYVCDVADYIQCEKTVKQVLADFGTVDILVNNAGITRDKLVLAMSPEDFDAVVDVNLKGAFHMIKLLYPVFLRKKQGKIVNVSSVSGLMGNAGQTNYSASKAGIIGLTKSIAKELASRGITCNAIAPGFIRTDMTAGFDADVIAKNIPLRRMGEAWEVARLVAFLASENANYITGEVIRIDGGIAM